MVKKMEEMQLRMEIELEKQKEKMSELEKQKEEMKIDMTEHKLKTQERIEMLESELARQLDPWARVRAASATSSGKRAAQQAFRDALFEKTSVCQLTGSKKNLKAAHIVPKCSEFLTPSERFNIHNGMLVCETVEHAFDQGKIIFQCDPLRNKATLVVLDKKILGDEVCHGKTWLQLQGSLLDTSIHRPSFKLLNVHAEFALKYCFDKKIINESVYNDLMVFAKFDSPPREAPISRWLFESRKDTVQAAAQVGKTSQSSSAKLRSGVSGGSGGSGGSGRSSCSGRVENSSSSSGGSGCRSSTNSSSGGGGAGSRWSNTPHWRSFWLGDTSAAAAADAASDHWCSCFCSTRAFAAATGHPSQSPPCSADQHRYCRPGAAGRQAQEQALCWGPGQSAVVESPLTAACGATDASGRGGGWSGPVDGGAPVNGAAAGAADGWQPWWRAQDPPASKSRSVPTEQQQAGDAGVYHAAWAGQRTRGQPLGVWPPAGNPPGGGLGMMPAGQEGGAAVAGACAEWKELEDPFEAEWREEW